MKPLLIFSSIMAISTASFAQNLVDLDSPEFGAAVRQYLMDNPEAIFESVEHFQKEQAELAQEQAEKSLAELEPKLLEEQNAIILGNPDAEIAFVELIDYNCGYCRKAHEAINAILEKNDDVKFVVRQFPILSQGSLDGAQVALAIKQIAGNEKAKQFHDQAYEANEQMSLKLALDLAEGLGLDRAEIETASQSPEVLSEISLISQSAQELNITGTPGFILNGKVYAGFIPEDNLQQIIDQTRSQ